MNKLKQAPGIVVEEMDDEILLYRPSTHKAIHLNGTAAVIWKLCDGTRTTQDLAGCLSAEFPSAQPSIAAEVQETVNLLLRDGVLVEHLSESSD
jgi:Coenzyme PQQ synthesis protein D (PqqD)